MSAAELERKIRTSIPLSEAMQFSIQSLDLDSIHVSAPLEPNINIHGTGFAGSIFSLAVLTGWAMCMHIMQEFRLDAELVIHNAEIRYRAPVTAQLDCRSSCSNTQRESFLQGVESSGKGKLVLDVDIGEQRQARLQATFYAFTR